MVVMVKVKAPRTKGSIGTTFFTPGKHFSVLMIVFSTICFGAVVLKFHRAEVKKETTMITAAIFSQPYIQNEYG
jgi:uncharacterized membrane protein YfhO